jgi:hypothetical protein
VNNVSSANAGGVAVTRNAQHDITVPATTPGRTRRRSRHERWAIALVGGVVIVHGAIHLLGAAKGLGWADVPALAQPITALAGAGWLLAAAVTATAGALLLASVRWWWMVGAAAVVLSQVMIVLDLNNAAVGTVPNVVLAAAVIYAYAAHGPTSFENEYQQRAGNALRFTPMDHGDGPVLTERDLESLPAPVARYVRQSGAVGKPYIGAFQAIIHGRIRSAADKPWMEFTGEQVEHLRTPARTVLHDERDHGPSAGRRPAHLRR